MDASFAIPFIPDITVIVYTKAMSIRIIMESPIPFDMPNTLLTASESKGVASEKVVAVPAISANIAMRSITFPNNYEIGRASCRERV